INVPSEIAYEPGTNVLRTTWKTPSGWVVVRDALTMGARGGADTVTPHTRPPADDDADHTLVRTVECIDGQVEGELVCEPIFDYGRGGGERPPGGRGGGPPPTRPPARPGGGGGGAPRPPPPRPECRRPRLLLLVL